MMISDGIFRSFVVDIQTHQCESDVAPEKGGLILNMTIIVGKINL